MKHTCPILIVPRTAPKLPAWSEEIALEVTIDLDRLCNILGPRAARNKSGGASLQGGLIRATVLRRRVL